MHPLYRARMDVGSLVVALVLGGGVLALGAFGVAAAGLLVGLAGWVAVDQRRDGESLLAMFAALGLRPVARGVEGLVDGRVVQVWSESVRRGRHQHVVWHVAVRATEVEESFALRVLERLSDGGGRTGDPAFDRVFRLPSSHPLALAFLDADTRRQLAMLRAACADGWVTTRRPSPPSEDHVRRLVAFADRLAAVDLIPSLAAIAERDDLPSVRYRALTVLAAHDLDAARVVAVGAARSDSRDLRGVITYNESPDTRRESPDRITNRKIPGGAPGRWRSAGPRRSGAPGP